jgi:predicted metal-binding protein
MIRLDRALPERGSTAVGFAILARRPGRCRDCVKRSIPLCQHPDAGHVRAAADALDALVDQGQAKRVDGERLGNGGLSSTIWYPS